MEKALFWLSPKGLISPFGFGYEFATYEFAKSY